ncbi:MAG: GNAT family N-acetyltransferase [Rudaea sp.]|uniref:GNAT family N-acetyltransferase n=1 Tax=Rudaea sp. TaxID=2136325 RepID=UPI0039E314B5
MNARVRLATIHDLDTLTSLFDAYRQFYRQPGDLDYARAFLRERFAHHESTVLLAFAADDAAVGFTHLYPLFSSVRCVRTYLLNDLFVAPGARRHGVGKALLNAAADFARANGAASLSLSTATDNLPAQRLYESLGWMRETGFLEYHLPLPT